MYIARKIITTVLILGFFGCINAQSATSVPGAPRLQPTVPEGFKEVPYSEKHQLPEITVQEQADGFMLFSRPITQPVYKTSVPLASERVDGISAFAALGEYEPVTFSIYPLRDIKNMRVSVSNLKDGDSVIGSKDLDLRLVTSWNIRYPLYTSQDTYQNMPELLEAVTVNSFAKGECQRYWLTVHVPADAKPGIYTGEFTISDDALSKSLQLPVTFRVLDYTLQKDPAKRYTAFYNQNRDVLRDMSKEMLKTATQNEYSAMQKYGIDALPSIYCGMRKGKDGMLELYIPKSESVDKMISMGFKGPVILVDGGIVMKTFYAKHVPDGKIGSHFAISKNPANDEIYKDIEQAFRKLNLECKAKGWPEIICCPIDEVSSDSADFASKVFAAVRKSGMKTFITKDPTATDAEIFRKADAVDAWCPQPFSMPYEKVIADKRCEYWSYPNHIAGEIKDRVTMQKGGRMTYGFGLWRSGYQVLMPWNWSWTGRSKDEFDYLRDRISGCGSRFDEQGEVIPAVYWECFREGRDDARYVYTLQQAIYERRNSQDPHCRELIKQGEALLQSIWDSIKPQQKYQAADMWPDEQFTVVRWRLAGLTEKLLKFPATDKGNAPSVMVNTAKLAARSDAFTLVSETGALESLNLGENKFAAWKALDKEAGIKVIESNGQPVLCMTVNVDHKIDGSKKDGKYPIGWPMFTREFAPGKVVPGDYDFLEFNVKIDSNRDEVADDHTPVTISFIGYGDFKYEFLHDFGDRQREWFPVRIAISDLIKRSKLDISKWMQPLKNLRLVISERKYQDGTRLQFEFDRIALIKVKHPVVAGIECPEAILLPAKYFSMDITSMGVSGSAVKDNYQLMVKLASQDGKVITSKTVNLSAVNDVALDIKGIPAGQCRLEAMIIDKAGRTISSLSKNLEAIDGYAAPAGQ